MLAEYHTRPTMIPGDHGVEFSKVSTDGGFAGDADKKVEVGLDTLYQDSQRCKILLNVKENEKAIELSQEDIDAEGGIEGYLRKKLSHINKEAQNSAIDAIKASYNQYLIFPPINIINNKIIDFRGKATYKDANLHLCINIKGEVSFKTIISGINIQKFELKEAKQVLNTIPGTILYHGKLSKKSASVTAAGFSHPILRSIATHPTFPESFDELSKLSEKSDLKITTKDITLDSGDASDEISPFISFDEFSDDALVTEMPALSEFNKPISDLEPVQFNNLIKWKLPRHSKGIDQFFRDLNRKGIVLRLGNKVYTSKFLKDRCSNTDEFKTFLSEELCSFFNLKESDEKVKSAMNKLDASFDQSHATPLNKRLTEGVSLINLYTDKAITFKPGGGLLVITVEKDGKIEFEERLNTTYTEDTKSFPIKGIVAAQGEYTKEGAKVMKAGASTKVLEEMYLPIPVSDESVEPSISPIFKDHFKTDKKSDVVKASVDLNNEKKTLLLKITDDLLKRTKSEYSALEVDKSKKVLSFFSRYFPKINNPFEQAYYGAVSNEHMGGLLTITDYIQILLSYRKTFTIEQHKHLFYLIGPKYLALYLDTEPSKADIKQICKDPIISLIIKYGPAKDTEVTEKIYANNNLISLVCSSPKYFGVIYNKLQEIKEHLVNDFDEENLWKKFPYLSEKAYLDDLTLIDYLPEIMKFGVKRYVLGEAPGRTEDLAKDKAFDVIVARLRNSEKFRAEVFTILQNRAKSKTTTGRYSKGKDNKYLQALVNLATLDTSGELAYNLLDRKFFWQRTDGGVSQLLDKDQVQQLADTHANNEKVKSALHFEFRTSLHVGTTLAEEGLVPSELNLNNAIKSIKSCNGFSDVETTKSSSARVLETLSVAPIMDKTSLVNALLQQDAAIRKKAIKDFVLPTKSTKSSIIQKLELPENILLFLNALAEVYLESTCTLKLKIKINETINFLSFERQIKKLFSSTLHTHLNLLNHLLTMGVLDTYINSNELGMGELYDTLLKKESEDESLNDILNTLSEKLSCEKKSDESKSDKKSYVRIPNSSIKITDSSIKITDLRKDQSPEDTPKPAIAMGTMGS